MHASIEGLVTRSEIARLAGVNRPAVTNWARRHDDFPRPVDSGPAGTGEADRFHVSEVAAWLAMRRIPVNGLRADEPEGTTYGDRFLAFLGGEQGVHPQALLTRLLDDFRGEGSVEQVLDLLIAVTYVVARRGEAPSSPDGSWQAVQQALAEDGIDGSPLGPSRTEGRRYDRFVAYAAGLVAEADWGRDTAVEALDWLIEQRSGTEGRRGNDLVTPAAVRRLMAELVFGSEADGEDEEAEPGLEGRRRTILDPFCRTGEILDTCAAVADRTSQASLFVRGAVGEPADAVLTRMRLVLRDVPHAIETADVPGAWWSGAGERFAGVVSNPPFNQRMEESWDARIFRYGPPPARSANFAWLQLALSALAPGGRAAVLMPNIAVQSASRAERALRAAMVEDGAVEALVALPPQLFGKATSIPVTLWLLRSPTGAAGEVLFVDAASLGSMSGRVRRTLSAADVESVVDVCRRWRSAREGGESFSGEKGFSALVSADTLAARDWLLSPVLHVEAVKPAREGSADGARIGRLIADLARWDERARKADRHADEILSGFEREDT
ncbi:hypothetical protein GCM10010497_11290 [Streptomyces cinereoruber]|uniref:DNA methylase adenine-specific domain-containing protein n=1 Tax=Streptomyces cinereoruber TaxID=67260 RepID=A0AAV4KDP1_9ACTN|nr:N-6 DNA methylase [Streptomyces cinereoruber]MBB4156684.1 type I restriction enzyme M protein [Streptomyces cinereoruber]MBY8815484.1 SAM-dependent methyltransferase [Streptomyces cinereoruber]NIH60218.1 type I restriction enzyme M protein [Streptomyces cinereoruber]QEV33973.1 hypothetical protein CP977_18895 [Streptomyces cinereoruber]GGR10788.1 hypothetical protein GCM10010497_11290 [Streptomyces cinereoruber]